MNEGMKIRSSVSLLYTLLLLLGILIGVVANYMLVNYRLGNVEKVAARNEARIELIEKNLIEINVKLDLLIENAGISKTKIYNSKLRGGK